MRYELSPSILAADFACLGEQISRVERAAELIGGVKPW